MLKWGPASIAGLLFASNSHSLQCVMGFSMNRSFSVRFGTDKHVSREVSNIVRIFCSFRIFSDKIDVDTFSLLPAPLHVAYRDKDEDDDLEKAYKEVCVDF